MLEIEFGVTGNGAADTTGAEQEDGLLEQGGANLSDSGSAADVVEERQHVERRASDLTRRRWR
jgi:hypothetical protein